MINMKYIKIIKNDEQGFASITIALVLVLVLSLITVGFAQLARREQQSALNKQLASQAQYAAESGINDVIKKIQTTPAFVSSPNTCIPPADITGPTTPPTPPGNVIDSGRDVSYTCALADLNPDSLSKDLGADSSWHTSFSTDQPISNLDINWKSKSGGTITPQTIPFGDFTPSTSWGTHPAVLQVNITPLNGALSRDEMVRRSFTVYLYPSSGGLNTVAYQSYTVSGAAANQGKIVSGNCNGGECSAKITGLDGGIGPYLLHIVDYYDPSTILIKGTPVVGTTPIKFLNAQAKIDVTGKARNVLKRLQVRLPLAPGFPLPSYAIEAQNICKRLQTEPNETKYINKSGGIATNSGDPCFLND